MFSYFGGASLGRKLAVETGTLCGDIVNFLIRGDYEVKLPDTVYILRESYAFCSFVIGKPGTNANKLGAMVAVSQKALRDWLIDVFSKCLKEFDFTESVDSVISELEGYFSDWVNELAAENPDLKGKDISKWYPAACAQFWMHVDYYTYSRFGKAPEKFSGYLQNLLNEMMNRSLSRWEKAAVVKSLEEEMSEDLKRKLDDLE